jgi:hypothetical protein
VLIYIGASSIYGLRNWWPLIIVVVGILLSVYGWQRLREIADNKMPVIEKFLYYPMINIGIC